MAGRLRPCEAGLGLPTLKGLLCVSFEGGRMLDVVQHGELGKEKEKKTTTQHIPPSSHTPY